MMALLCSNFILSSHLKDHVCLMGVYSWQNIARHYVLWYYADAYSKTYSRYDSHLTYHSSTNNTELPKESTTDYIKYKYHKILMKELYNELDIKVGLKLSLKCLNCELINQYSQYM